MRQQQVILAQPSTLLPTQEPVRQAVKDGARVATMPGITPEMFTPMVECLPTSMKFQP